jgi:hypothetical protein
MPYIIENEEKWYSHVLSAEDFKQFCAEALASKTNTKAFIGSVNPEAMMRIKAITDITVAKIMVDSGAIRHAYAKAEHCLESDDIFHLVDVINTSTDIQLSDMKHQNNKILVFKKNIHGNIVFVEEARIQYGGWLALVTCYREKKAGRHSDAT